MKIQSPMEPIVTSVMTHRHNGTENVHIAMMLPSGQERRAAIAIDGDMTVEMLVDRMRRFADAIESDVSEHTKG